MANNLLQSAIMHAAMRGLNLDDARKQAEEEIERRRTAEAAAAGTAAREDGEEASDEGYDDDDDDAFTDVHSIISTRPSSPFGSRPSSPAPGSSSRRPRTSRLRDSLQARHSLDPLKRLPTAVNLKIFTQCSVKDLKNCSQICRRWKKSQTLNHVWYILCQTSTWEDVKATRITATGGQHSWTRRESKIDWRGVYRRTHRRDDTSAPVGLEGYKYNPQTGEWYDPATVGQLTGKEAIWAEQANREETKDEARLRYKSMGARSKPKGKRDKWTGARDITGFEEPVEFDD